MSYVDIIEFRGFRPGQHPDNQPIAYSTKAQNILPSSGEFVPAYDNLTLAELAAPQDIQSVNEVLRNDGTYDTLYLPDISYAGTPIIEDQFDRIYFAGSTDNYLVLSLRDDTGGGILSPRPYEYFVAPPLRPFVVGLSNNPIGRDFSVVFTMTYLTDRGEQSPPSFATPIYGFDDGDNITSITFGVRVDTDTQLTVEKFRLYARTGSTYYLVAEIDKAATTALADAFYPNVGYSVRRYQATGLAIPVNPFNVDDPLIGQPLDTLEAKRVPENMQNIINAQNGMVMGVSRDRKTVYVSERFNPLSFPQAIPIANRVQRLIRNGTNVLALTDSKPQIILGASPDTTYALEVPFAQGCMSRYGVVDMGYAILYPCPDGIAEMRNGRGRVVTKDNRIDGDIEIFNNDQWAGKTINDANFRAARYEGLYIFYRLRAPGIWDGWAYNPRHREVHLLKVLLAEQLYMLQKHDNELVIYRHHGANNRMTPEVMFGSTSRLRGQWERTLSMPGATPMPYARVTASTYNDIELVIDGIKVPVADDQIFTVPSMERKRRYTIGLEGSDVVQRLQLSQDAERIE